MVTRSTTTTTRPPEPDAPSFTAPSSGSTASSSTSANNPTNGYWAVGDDLLNASLWVSGQGTSGGWGTSRTDSRTRTFMTGQEFLAHFYDIEDPSQLQLQLYLNGYYDKGVKLDDIQFGQHDRYTYSALTRVATVAARSRRSVEELLNEIPATTANIQGAMAHSGGRGGGGHAVHTNVIQHTSPTDLHEAAIAGFQAALGYAPSKEEEAKFIAAFHGKETAAQPETAGGGTFNITDPGNPTNAAKAQAEQSHPGDADSYKRLQMFGTMLGALGAK